MGFAADPAKTPAEVVAEVASTDDNAARELQPLANEVVRATYADSASVSADRAAEAERITETIAAHAKAKRGGFEWWWQHASPINVWRDKVGAWGNLRPRPQGS